MEQGLTPEDLIERGKKRADAYIASLSFDQLLEGVGTDKILKQLGPEWRLAGLGPEERLKGLSVEEIEAYLRKLKNNND